MRHGSLFSGYGGIDRAIADVFGAETAWVSDVDPGANAILAHRYPDAPNLGDITAVDWSTVEPVDIISGGSPCQDLSMAGRRAGMTPGTRSNLWESMREAIAVIRPSFVVWENVYGALSANASSSLEHCPGCMGGAEHGGPVLRALGRVLGDLSDLGFDAQWHGLRAADVGACHGRFRVFVLAYARGVGGHQAIEHDGRGARVADGLGVPHERNRHALRAGPDRALTLLPTPRAQARDVAYAREDYRFNLEEWAGHFEAGTLEATTSRSKDSSGDLMPPSAVVQLLPTPTTTQRGTDANLDTREGARANLHNEVAKLLPTPTTEPMTGNGHARNLGKEVTRWGEYAAAIARHERAFGRPAPDPTEPGPKGNPRLSARFCEWMMMLPAGWVTDVPGVTRNQALKALGNGVVPPQAAAALRLMLDRIEAA